ncbi:LLM class flavin-dependent oxidoreductase [Salinibacterium sp. dk2585]|uniref:LLM class flavin-dependent oxidoreductase n=1 Tax=unclassified Salinibacterium TaxID=2632331 RepID=UPI0011C2479E|nr:MULTISPECIES: LLM class flavin-dependent oxidoreductase [unclassified Salinibacterium]QEE61552.1 LLM class flavin-dependent oxidoreductase [Salinibacterium sp. dk2585]TXK52479.1 LLM class flavin-dependent oxidoreductase [Salinibacterium sp. dk5596]
MSAQIELGLDTFGDVMIDAGGRVLSHAESIRNIVEQAVLADGLGIDFIGIGEHHRADFAVSAPEVVLAGIATRTSRIKLGSAVTVLSSDDPVRVFERFSTVDALSNGRAEVIIGRGSFTESFPLFGFDMGDYQQLFEEKIELFSELIKNDAVTWSGTMRSSLTEQHVYPKLERGTLKTWVGVGGSPESVVRAAHFGLPLMLAIIGGDPLRFAPYADLYKRALAQFDRDELPIGAHSPGHVAASDQQAADELFPHFKANRDNIGRERGWPPMTRAEYEQEIAQGALFVGSPETVASKIVRAVRGLGLSRFDLKYANGTMPHAQLMSSIGLYGREVLPRVREMLAAEA